MRMSQERKIFIFDFSFLHSLRLFASYFELLFTFWKASKSLYLTEAQILMVLAARVQKKANITRLCDKIEKLGSTFVSC